MLTAPALPRLAFLLFAPFPRSGNSINEQLRPDFQPSGQPNNDFVVLRGCLLGESARFRADPFRQRFTSVPTFTARTNRVRNPRLTTVPAATRCRLSHARRVRSHPPGLATSPRRVDSRIPRHVQPIPHLGWFRFIPFALPPLPTEGPELPSSTGPSLPFLSFLSLHHSWSPLFPVYHSSLCATSSYTLIPLY